MELTYSEVIEMLNRILEFLDFFGNDIDAMSNKFDLIRKKVHDIFVEKPLIPNSAETVLSLSIDKSEILAKGIRGNLTQIKRDFVKLREEAKLQIQMQTAAKQKRSAY
ncbi:unnamed protein product [Rhizophagus irregularis]|nr:unnamed protein product [Rhizophagus irregularis]